MTKKSVASRAKSSSFATYVGRVLQAGKTLLVGAVRKTAQLGGHVLPSIAPQHETGVVQSRMIEVPALPLADALYFANPSAAVIARLARHRDRWMEAVVLSTPFWDRRTDKFLNNPIDLRGGVPSFVAASVRFDADRELIVGDFASSDVTHAKKGNVFALFRYYSSPKLPGQENGGIITSTEQTLGAVRRVRVQLSVSVAYLAFIGRSMTNLRVLTLSDCRHLRDLSTLVPLGRSLEELYLHNCRQLVDVSALSNLIRLEVLFMAGFRSIADVTAIASLTSLRVLELRGKGYIKHFASPVSLPKPLVGFTTEGSALQELRVEPRWDVDDLNARLPTMRFLKVLELCGCRELVALPPLPVTPHLETLIVKSCNMLVDIAALQDVPTIRELELSRCYQLSDISPVGSLRALRKLRLHDCGLLSDMSPLAGLPSIEVIIMNHLPVADLQILASLPTLGSLDLSNSFNLVDISALASAFSLETLDLSGCEQVADISALVKLRNLRELDLTFTFVTDVSVLPAFRKLEKLDLSHMELTDLSPLVALPSTLKDLKLDGCDKLRDLTVLNPVIASLQRLSLCHCSQLSDVSPLGGAAKHLEELRLSGCKQLRELSTVVGLLPSLLSLDIRGCQQVRDAAQLQVLNPQVTVLCF